MSSSTISGPSMPKKLLLQHSQELDDLFTKYGSDKNRNGYSPVYHSLFKHIRDQPIDFLEIGIGTMIPGVYSSMVGFALEGYAPGGSLRAWRDFFKNGNVYGADIQPDTQFKEERIQTMLINSVDKENVDRTIKDVCPTDSFDVILDDGAHHPDMQFQTFKNFYPYLKKGGYYIIEDVGVNSTILSSHLPKIREIAHDALVYAAYVWGGNGKPKIPILIISKRC